MSANDIDWLRDRGLADMSTGLPADGMEIAAPAMPPDYPARCQAMEFALRAEPLTDARDRYKLLSRAYDIHAFLMARNTTDEGVQNDE